MNKARSEHSNILPLAACVSGSDTITNHLGLGFISHLEIPSAAGGLQPAPATPGLPLEAPQVMAALGWDGSPRRCRLLCLTDWFRLHLSIT